MNDWERFEATAPRDMSARALVLFSDPDPLVCLPACLASGHAVYATLTAALLTGLGTLVFGVVTGVLWLSSP